MAGDLGGAYGSGWPAGHELAADTPAVVLLAHGVEISSRYQKHHEMVLLARLVDRLPQEMRAVLREIWCNSKAEAEYIAEVREGHDRAEVTAPIAARIAAILMEMRGGHNGVHVGETATEEPDWKEDLG